MSIDPRIEFLNQWYERKFIYGEETDASLLNNPWIYDKDNGFETELHEIIDDVFTYGKHVEFLNEVIAYQIKKEKNELHQRALQIQSNKNLQKRIETKPAEDLPEIINSVLKETEISKIDAFLAENSRLVNDKDEGFTRIPRHDQCIVTISPDFIDAVEDTDTSKWIKLLEEPDEQMANINDITIREEDDPIKEDLIPELDEIFPVDTKFNDELAEIIAIHRHSGSRKPKDQERHPIIEKLPTQEIPSNPPEVIPPNPPEIIHSNSPEVIPPNPPEIIPSNPIEVMPQSEASVQPPGEEAQPYLAQTVPSRRRVKKPIKLYYQTKLKLNFPKLVTIASINVQIEKYEIDSILISELSGTLIEGHKRIVETEVRGQSSISSTPLSLPSLSAQISKSTLIPIQEQIEGEISAPNLFTTPTNQRKLLNEGEIVNLLNDLNNEEENINEKNAATSQLPPTATAIDEIFNEISPENEDLIHRIFREHSVRIYPKDSKNKRRRKRRRPQNLDGEDGRTQRNEIIENGQNIQQIVDEISLVPPPLPPPLQPSTSNIITSSTGKRQIDQDLPENQIPQKRQRKDEEFCKELKKLISVYEDEGALYDYLTSTKFVWQTLNDLHIQKELNQILGHLVTRRVVNIEDILTNIDKNLGITRFKIILDLQTQGIISIQADDGIIKTIALVEVKD